jgi:hypothetical protein
LQPILKIPLILQLYFCAGESEAVIVNLMGEIRPEQFGDVMVALEVDAPGVDGVKVAQTGEG